MSIVVVERYLSELIALCQPHAATGVLLAATMLALSRLPLLNIAALTAASVCLGAILSSGPGQIEAAMQMAAAGVVAAGVLLLSGGELWRRPALRQWLRRRREEAAAEAAGAAARADSGLAATWLFRLAAVAVLALAAEALAPVWSIAATPEEARLALWLAGMGLFAGLSGGNAVVSGSGWVMALSALSLLVPKLVSDITQQPMAYALAPVLMILTALAFSFAAVLHKGEKGVHRKDAEDAGDAEKGAHRKDAEDAGDAEKGAHRKGAEDAGNTEKGFHHKDAEDAGDAEKGAHRKDAEHAGDAEKGAHRKDAEDAGDAEEGSYREGAENAGDSEEKGKGR